MIVGVSGVAGAGKDLFVDTCVAELARRGKSTLKIAIATELKSELQSWCLNHYGIDPLNSSREDKEKIREFLVFHGVYKRKQSNGRHWLELASKAVNDAKHNYDYLFISDVRYNDYPEDEVHWVKEELQGKLVHVSQYEIAEVLDKRNWPKTKVDRAFLPPANAEEERNAPKLRKAADYILEWEMKTDINKHKYISSKVVSFIEEVLEPPAVNEEIKLETNSTNS